MISIKIKYDSALNRKIYRKYFDFVFNKSIENYAYKPSILVLFSLIIIGLFTKIFILSILGGFILLFGFLFYGFYKFKLNISFKKFMKEIEIKSIESEKDFIFSFNETEIIYESTNIKNNIQFSLIKYFEENDNDLYLYLGKEQLFDVISASKIGQENYDLFKSFLIKKTL